MTTDRLLSEVQTFANKTRDEPLIAGYWIRDDVPWWDEGHAGAVLSRIAKILPAGKPTICGFSASIARDNRRGSGGIVGTGWIPRGAADYSATACDYVALYSYSGSVPISEKGLHEFDWTMKRVLPVVLHDLKAHGWTPLKSPLIGVVQAWGGRLAADPRMKKVTPSAKSLSAQTEAFCKAGATGVFFYAYTVSASAFLDWRTPANDSKMEDGVRRGIDACRMMWAAASGPAR